MICTSLQHKTLEEIFCILQNPYVEMAEIRLDLCDLSDSDIEELFSGADKPLVATCRSTEQTADEALRRLEIAVQAGAHYADLEVEAPVRVSQRLRKVCRECGAGLIRSWHDFSGTPDGDTLEMYVGRCLRYGADVVKIVTACQCPEDAGRILSLYGKPGRRGRLIAFGMGEEGRDTRIECLRKGAPFTYAALSDEDATAPGQWRIDRMHKAVYGAARTFFRNSLEMPASKSFAQRAILCAAIAQGTSHLRGYTPCEDSEAAIEVAKALGAKVRRGRTLTITGIGAARGCLGLEKLHTGNSGLLARLCIPLLSVLNRGEVLIDGGEQLRARPMESAADIMAAFGVMLHPESSGKDRQIHLPLRLQGPLMSGNADISGRGGSQLISGLLMALPLCPKPSRVFVSDPRSIPYMFITSDVLASFGVKVSSEMEDGITFHIPGGCTYKAAELDIEGDWSAAAAFLVAGAVFGSAQVQGLSSRSLQADLAICDILLDAGASLSSSEEGDDICVCKGPLEGFEADLNNAPDLFPVVAVLAAFCEGETRLRGVRRLLGKECNRADAISEMLSKMGVPVSVDGDEMLIRGENYCSRILGGRLLKGGAFSSSHDHRMVMALTIASLGAAEPVVIDDTACVAKSFPEFFEMFD
ncbi:MAG: 3-phosphoshikimate 1-carboxyvinyltransferase [Bacteroidales bacterium]|nr:3-phosphoshikimate 1-carboxyvinyltransferase [Bacteroidales bacterium]